MTTHIISEETLGLVVLQGDLSRLTGPQRSEYLLAVCSSLGLNPLTKPFDFISLSGKLVLYAKKDATDQIRRINRINIAIISRERIEDVYVVTARASRLDGNCDESSGAVAIGGLKGDALANAIMKAETKAKRRVTLSICGLGILDEAEIESIPTSRVSHEPPSGSVETAYAPARPSAGVALWSPSVAQSKRIFAIAKQCGVTADGVKAIMIDNNMGLDASGEPNTALLSREQYDSLCDNLIPGVAMAATPLDTVVDDIDDLDDEEEGVL